MAKLTKRQKAIAEKVVAGKQYSFEEAAKLLAELSTIKFKESVDVAVNLGVDPRKSDQVVRGATVLPNGTGKSVRVAVFTQGPAAEAALAAGADKVGMDELAAEMKGRMPRLVRYVSVPTRTASSTAPSVRSISSRPSCSRTLKRCWLT